SDSKKVGTLQNFEESDGEIIKWDHFYLELPKNFVQSSLVNSIASTKGSYRSKKDVFQRAMEEITEDSVEIILELISQNSLYKGEEWQETLQEFLDYKKKYVELNTEEEKNNFVWQNVVGLYDGLARIRNTSIGTLLVDISEGMNLDQAVRQYETIVAPENYQRSKPIFTKKMLEDARKKVDELGYKE